jgi:RNA 2',3'-cyclic 3'-phosphodiesterase
MTTHERWRCFVAVQLGGTLRADLARSVDAWQRDPELVGLRWADPAAWHVTLAFLGGIAAADIAAVETALKEVAGAAVAMTLRTGGLGAFPSAGRARVLWYRVDDTDGELAELAAAVSWALGLEPADRFQPHVTLARARREPVALRAWLGSAVAPT